MNKYIIILIFSFILNSCIKSPIDNSPISSSKAELGDILVLEEGLQGFDNSALTLIKSMSGEIVADYFKSSNSDQFLGDTANDIIQKGDTALIVMSGSSIIRLIRISDGKFIKNIELPFESMPRKIAKVSDSLFCVSLLFKSTVAIININNNQIISEIQVGPQPEGITFFNNYIYTANSAYGDLNYKHKDAETISVIDFTSNKEIKKILCGPNCNEVLINPKHNKLYGIFYNLPSKENVKGGIIEYDLTNLEEIRRWDIRAHSVRLSTTMDSLIFISQMSKGSSMSEQSGISCIDLLSGNQEMIIKNPNKNDMWYNIDISPYDSSIWLCNAKNHINNGEILVFNNKNNNLPILKFNVLQNPNKIIFVE